MKPKVIERFWSKVARRGPDECWLWLASKTGKGYGTFHDDPSQLLAHRIAYELAKGPIPAGLQIDHLCRNRACCNPVHLEAVSCRENILRGSGLAAQHARATHCPKGHPYDEENTYHAANGSRGCKRCIAERNRRWKSR